MLYANINSIVCLSSYMQTQTVLANHVICIYKQTFAYHVIYMQTFASSAKCKHKQYLLMMVFFDLTANIRFFFIF